MSRAFVVGDIEAFKEARDRHEAEEGWMIDAALADIAAGQLDSEAIHLALKLGHHLEYPKLKQAHEDAIWAARQAGTL